MFGDLGLIRKAGESKGGAWQGSPFPYWRRHTRHISVEWERKWGRSRHKPVAKGQHEPSQTTQVKSSARFFYRFPYGLFEFVDALVKSSCHRQYWRFADAAFELLEVVLGHRLVHFVCNHEARSFQKRRIV